MQNASLKWQVLILMWNKIIILFHQLQTFPSVKYLPSSSTVQKFEVNNIWILPVSQENKEKWKRILFLFQTL